MEESIIKDHKKTEDPKKSKFVVEIRRDSDMMLTYIKFFNRVKHPRVSFNLFVTGVLLLLVPTLVEELAFPGVVVSYGMGMLLVVTALFRQYLSLSLMKHDPAVHENEEISYLFGNSGVRVRQNGGIENMGYYKTIYRIWEDERTYYVGMNDEDLLILPKDKFVQGDETAFKEFILEKSGADYRWKPVKPGNRWRQFLLQIRGHITKMRMDARERERKR